MSHNSKKIANIQPNVSSVYAVKLEDLPDVDITNVSNGNTLAWNSTNSKWEGSSTSGTLENQYIKIGEGASNAFSNSNATLNNGDPIAFYGPNAVNNISGASLSGDGTDWYERITLPAGKYEVEATAKFEFSADGHVKYSIRKNAGTAGSSNGTEAFIGDSTSWWYFNCDVGVSCSKYVFNASENDYIEVVILSQRNLSTAANQGNTPAIYNQLIVRKL